MTLVWKSQVKQFIAQYKKNYMLHGYFKVQTLHPQPPGSITRARGNSVIFTTGCQALRPLQHFFFLCLAHLHYDFRMQSDFSLS